MVRILLVILIISLIGNLFGLYVLYKTAKVKRELAAANRSIENLTDALDHFYSKSMVFLHHSVGYGILHHGGLIDSLRSLGITVKSATYGDDIGNETDICDWLPKFQNDMDRILKFKAHPNIFYTDDRTNDIVMFKSCFPNSDLAGDGSEPGDPLNSARTIANYKALFNRLQNEIKQYKDKLFIYLTAPPLVPEATSPDNARRARKFNRWLISEFLPQYRKETGADNFIIFDLFDVLADEDNYLKKEYRQGRSADSHPNALANKVVAQKFMEFFQPIWERWQGKAETKEAISGL